MDDEFDWGEVYKRLLAYTLRKLGRDRAEDAEEITQEALGQFFDPKYYDWDRSKGEDLDDLLQDLGSRINGLVGNYWKKRKRRGDPISIEREPGADGASPEGRVVSADDVQQAVSAVLERLGDNDEVAVDVMLKMAEGIEHAGDIADALSIERKVVYNARRRLAPHIVAVRAQLGRENP